MSDRHPSNPLNDRRRHSRSPTAGVSTLLGEVVDLSEGGIGVFRKGAPTTDVGNIHELTIRHEHTTVTVHARVTRITPMGFRRQEIGLELLEPSPAQCEAIRTIMALAARPEVGIGPRCWVAA